MDAPEENEFPDSVDHARNTVRLFRIHRLDGTPGGVLNRDRGIDAPLATIPAAAAPIRIEFDHAAGCGQEIRRIGKKPDAARLTVCTGDE